MKVAAYVRAPGELVLEERRRQMNMQLEALREVASQRGWEIVHTMQDSFGQKSGSLKSNKHFRDFYYQGVMKKEYELMMFWSARHMAGSGRSFLSLIHECADNGCHWYLHNPTCDSLSDSGEQMLKAAPGLLDIAAEFRKEDSRNRKLVVNYLDKRQGRPRITEEKEQAILKYRERGWGINSIAKKLRVGNGTVQRVVKHANL